MPLSEHLDLGHVAGEVLQRVFQRSEDHVRFSTREQLIAIRQTQILLAYLSKLDRFVQLELDDFDGISLYVLAFRTRRTPGLTRLPL
jgi:hypothetical protein